MPARLDALPALRAELRGWLAQEDVPPDAAEDIVLAHNQVFFAVQSDLRAGIFSEQNAIVDFDIQWSDFTIVIDFPFADRNHFAFLWFFLSGIGNDDPSLAFVLFGDAFDYTGADFRRWCGEVGFQRFDVVHLTGPSSAAVAYK